MSSQPSFRVIDFSFLRSRRVLWRIAIVTGVAMLAGVAYALLAPDWYTSTVSVTPVRSQRSGGLSSMLGGELGALAAGLGATGGDGTDVNRILAVLTSATVSDAVIGKFDLKHRYDQKYQESARDELWEHCSARAIPKPGLVQLSCEDKDPRFAQQMLEYFTEYGNQVFRRVGVSSATEQVRFLEKRVAELRAQADSVAARVRTFQEEHGIVDIETQTKAVVGAMAALNSQRIAKQLDLEFARTFSSGDEATTRQLESQLAVVDQKLKTLEVAPTPPSGGRPEARASKGMFPPALTVPKLRAEFETLYRDRKVAEVTLVYALERLESAKADEAKDTSTFLVLDPPTLPTRHTRPHRLSVLLALMLAACFGAVAFEWWRSGGSLLRHDATDKA